MRSLHIRRASGDSVAVSVVVGVGIFCLLILLVLLWMVFVHSEQRGEELTTRLTAATTETNLVKEQLGRCRKMVGGR